jgi:hypothetical protein
MDSPQEFGKYLKITLGMLIFIISISVSTTFVVTSIYWRFKLVEEEQKTMKLEGELREKRIEYVNSRIDRKFEQLKEEE